MCGLPRVCEEQCQGVTIVTSSVNHPRKILCISDFMFV